MKQPAICSCLSVLTANPRICIKAYSTELGSEISGGSDIKDCAEQFKPNIMYISNQRTTLPLYYIYTDLLQCLQQSPMFVEHFVVVGQHGLQSIPANQGPIGKKSLFTKKMSNPPPKNPVFRGMLRKTGISPYIGCFWVLLGVIRRLGCCMVIYGQVWSYMDAYGYIWCSGIYQVRSLYIDAQPIPSASSTYSFRTHCLIEQCERIGTTLSSLEI